MSCVDTGSVPGRLLRTEGWSETVQSETLGPHLGRTFNFGRDLRPRGVRPWGVYGGDGWSGLEVDRVPEVGDRESEKTPVDPVENLVVDPTPTPLQVLHPLPDRLTRPPVGEQ